jgi:hypothetical protein
MPKCLKMNGTGSGQHWLAGFRAAGLPKPDVKALVFDTFGTLVDWRNGVARLMASTEGSPAVQIVGTMRGSANVRTTFERVVCYYFVSFSEQFSRMNWSLVEGDQSCRMAQYQRVTTLAKSLDPAPFAKELESLAQLLGVWTSPKNETFTIEETGNDFSVRGTGLSSTGHVRWAIYNSANVMIELFETKCYYYVSLSDDLTSANWKFRAGAPSCPNGIFARRVPEAPSPSVAFASLVGQWVQQTARSGTAATLKIERRSDGGLQASVNGASPAKAEAVVAAGKVLLSFGENNLACSYEVGISDSQRRLRMELKKGSSTCPRGLFDRAVELPTTRVDPRQELSWLVGNWLHEESGMEIRIKYQNGVLEAKLGTSTSGTIHGASESGSNIRLEAGGNSCLYYVAIVGNGNGMNWRLQKGDSAKCISGAFARSTP